MATPRKNKAWSVPKAVTQMERTLSGKGGPSTKPTDPPNRQARPTAESTHEPLQSPQAQGTL